MSDSEGETVYDDEDNEEPVTDFGEEEDENKTDGEEKDNDGDKSSVGSGGFDAGDGDKPKKIEMPQETPLTNNMVKDGISMLCKTGDGLEIAYVKLDAQDKKLTNVFLLSTFIHLRYVNLSFNKLTSLSPLQNMRFLVSLKVAYNELTSAQMSNFGFLQVLDLTGNKLKTTANIKQTSLEKLIISKNKLEDLKDMNKENLPNLVHLDIANNALRSLDSLEVPSLKELYAAGNKIKSLSGISRLTSLVRLHLRDNRVRSLTGCEEDHPTLQYLNLRANRVEDPEELYELRRLRALQELVLAETPLAEEAEAYRSELLVYARRLQRIDKDPVEEEEREEAAELFPQREEERLVAERDGTRRPPSPDSQSSQQGEHEASEEEG